jgi:hypothetical protein
MIKDVPTGPAVGVTPVMTGVRRGVASNPHWVELVQTKPKNWG